MDNLQNIYARNCEVKRITRKAAKDFLDANHRLGGAECRYRYGLFVVRTTGRSELCLPKGTLVAVSGFSTPKHIMFDGRRVSSYEWVRYASRADIRVVGGMSKMLAAFVDEVHPDDVMSYADVSWCDAGAAYRTLGFVSEGLVKGTGFVNEKFRLKLWEY